MPERKSVIMLSSNPESGAAAAATLQAGSQFELVAVVDELSALKARLDRGDIQAAIIDIDRQPAQLMTGLASATSRFSGVRFIILTEQVRQDLLLEAMQAGARHVLDKQSLQNRLETVLRRLVADGGGRVDGRVTTLLSAGGGCGSTTLALNLANELGLLTGEPALLVDMDLNCSAVAVWLGLTGQFGLHDVLAFGDGIDAHLVRSTSQTVADHLHVLLSPAVGPPAPPAFEHLDDTLEACRYAYGHTVIDAPRVPLNVAARLAMASAATLIVMQLTVRDIHVARTLVADLTAEGLDPQQIGLLINRRSKRDGVPLDEASRALGGLPLYCIRNDYRTVARAMNHGRMMSDAAPSSPMRKDLSRLADAVRNASLQTLIKRYKP